MTDRLAELETLLDRATPGPWEDASTDDGPFDYQVHTVADDSWSLVGLVPSPHDARLIARLVTAAPGLLAVAKEAQHAARLSHCVQDGQWCDPHQGEPWPCPVVRLRAALAKLGVGHG